MASKYLILLDILPHLQLRYIFAGIWEGQLYSRRTVLVDAQAAALATLAGYHQDTQAVPLILKLGTCSSTETRRMWTCSGFAIYRPSQAGQEVHGHWPVARYPRKHGATSTAHSPRRA